MKSVSGKNWEEKNLSRRIIEKIKLENNFNDITAKQILAKNFKKDEIHSINNNFDITNPFLNKSDFLQAIEIFDYSIKNNENICIIGDYDVDGCVSTSLFVKFLKNLNTNYYYYIPDRFKDGYGTSLKLVKKLLEKKPDLIIMVDNGSSSYEAINYLNKRKIKSIIIDHHEIYKPYPKSNVLINPKKKTDYSKFNYFCSAVLTYFFIDLYIKNKNLKLDFTYNLHLVLLAIISDVMPLRQINRSIAKIVLSKNYLNDDYIFKKIFELKNIKKPLEIDDFGFLFSPIFNSAGRLGNPNIIVELFTTNKILLKDQIINKLITLNEKRKIIEFNYLEKLDLKMIRSNNKSIIFIENNIMNEGIIGIIASNIKTLFEMPTVVITKSSDFYKGSARSVDNFSIGKYIKTAVDNKILESGGGHNLAAGFTIKKKNINRFKDYLNNLFKKNYILSPSRYLSKISLSALSNNFLSDLSKLKPYGQENQNPKFLIENLKIIKPKIINKKFISCLIKNKFGKTFPAISFNLINSEISNNLLYNKNELDLIVQIKENLWNNKKRLQIIIIDIINRANKA